jgi:hypothetical protein
MADEMSSIPPRVGSLEMELHTVKHRLASLEDVHRETPHRLTKVEIAVERLPQIEAKLSEQGDMIKRGFILTHGILLGGGAVWALFQAGPQFLKFLGGN